MGDPRGFLKLGRQKEKDRAIKARIQDWRELVIPASDEDLSAQASRCMDCGIPFCHQGCPLGNLIPEWNDLVYTGRHAEALESLHSTNNFPEVTSRVCPAPCEAACVLNIHGAPVTIKAVERAIADLAFSKELEPVLASSRTGSTVAVVGSGPAGLAVAQQLARRGHDVTVFERDDRLGGLLRYGIPDFKMEKELLDRRIAQIKSEGVELLTSVDAGQDIGGDALRSRFDAVVLAAGARQARDLVIEGRELGGIELAMEFLTQQNKRVAAGGAVKREDCTAIDARGKRVIVLGGGDTGSDCVGTSIRQSAASVLQLELMPKPELLRLPTNPWPEWPLILRTSTSQEEGANRDWAVMTKKFSGAEGHVRALEAVRVTLQGGKVSEIPDSTFEIPCELVLLAMGFVGPEKGALIDQLGVALDSRGNVRTTPTGATSVEGVFAAGDMARGQSLVVWAIADGRRVASGVDAYLRASQRSRSESRSSSEARGSHPRPG